MIQQSFFCVPNLQIWKHLFVKTYVPYVHCNIIYGGQETEINEVPFSGWLGKEVVHNTAQP